MALHTELPIYRTGVRLLSLAVKVQEQMPRSIKRILGDKITQHCVDLLDLMALANASQHEALRAELERLTRELAEEMEHTALLRTERDALREDAERYRYLRDVAWHSGSLIFYAERYGPEDWDEAIDAARKDTP
mgnify:CR=1 FL=1